MGFFDDNTTPKKFITEKEWSGTSLHSGLREKLMSGESNERLDRRRMDNLNRIVAGFRDADRAPGKGTHTFAGMDEREVKQVLDIVRQDDSFNHHQVAHIEKHFNDFLNNRKI